MRFNYTDVETKLDNHEMEHLKAFLRQVDIRKSIIEGASREGMIWVNVQYGEGENVKYKRFNFVNEYNYISICL